MQIRNAIFTVVFIVGFAVAEAVMIRAPDTPHPGRERAPVRTYGRTASREQDIRSLYKLAESGDANAQFELGMKYRHGRGAPVDIAGAKKWLHSAAEQGHAEAQYELGNLHDLNASGLGWDIRAHQQAEAEISFDKMSENMTGLVLHIAEQRRDEARKEADKISTEAVKLYRLAAEQGHVEAQYKLGNAYYYGNGVPKDYAAAAKWYILAAKQGHTWAQGSLGGLYADGKGVPQNNTEAKKWYRLAHEQGYECDNRWLSGGSIFKKILSEMADSVFYFLCNWVIWAFLISSGHWGLWQALSRTSLASAWWLEWPFTPTGMLLPNIILAGILARLLPPDELSQGAQKFGMALWVVAIFAGMITNIR